MKFPELDKLVQNNNFEDALTYIDSQSNVDQTLSLLLGVYRLEVLRKMGRFDEVFESTSELISRSIEGNHPIELIKLYGVIIASGMRINRMQDVDHAILEGRKLLSRISDESDEALHAKSDFLNFAAYYEVFQGKQSMAISDFTTSLQLRRQLGDMSKVYNTLNNLALAYQYNGDLEEAKELLEECLVYFQSLNDEFRSAHTLINIASLETTQGRIVDALRKLFRGLDYFRKLNNPQIIATTLLNIGNCLIELNEYNEAILVLEECRSINEELGDPKEMVAVYQNLGDLYKNMNEFDKAIEFFDMALNISLPSKLHYIAAISLYDKIGVLLILGKLSQATSEYLKFNDLVVEGDNNTIEILNDLSQALILSKKESLSDKVKAQDILRRYIDVIDIDYLIYISIMTEFLSLLLYEYKLTKQQSLFQEMKEITDKLLQFTEINHLTSSRCHILLIGSKIELIAGNFEQSRIYIDESYQLSEAMGSFKQSWLISSYYDELLILLSQMDKDPQIQNQFGQDQILEIENLLSFGRRNNVIPLEFEPEIALFFVIFNRKTKSILLNVDFKASQQYERVFIINIVHHINEFYPETVLTHEIERLHINNHSVLFYLQSDFGFAYIFKGKSFSAMYKLDSLITFLLGVTNQSMVEYVQDHPEDIISICKTALANTEISDNLNQNHVEEFYKMIPENIDDFKSILHPIRLSIITLLYRLYQIPRNELVNLLSINSGNLFTHLRVLLDGNLIGEKSEFIDGKARKMIMIEPKGVSVYLLFKEWTNRV